MIRSERRVEAPALNAHLSNTALVHSALRMHIVDNQHVVNEDILLTRAFRRAGRTSRPIVTVLLEGGARVSAYERHIWMKPGDVVAVDSKGAILMRQEGAPYMALALEWDPGPFGERGAPIVVRDGRTPMGSFRSVVEDVRGRRGRPAAAVARLARILFDLGLPIHDITESMLEEPDPEHMQDLTNALDASLSTLSTQPMISDLESRLGLSSRQLNRLIADYNTRYGFNSVGWIDTRNRRRLLVGATFMTAPGATAGYVAAQVGYRSRSAFARAMRLVGLPPPQDIGAEVERIRLATQ